MPMRLSPPRSPFWFAEGAAWCMMQHPVRKRGRPGASGVPAPRSLRGTGRRDARVVAGAWGRGAGTGPGRRPETFPYMARSGARRPAARSTTCHRPRVGSPPGGGGWSRGRWPAEDGVAHPQAGRGAHVSSSLEPCTLPGPPPSLFRVPGVISGKSPSRGASL